MIDSFSGHYRFLSNFYPCLIRYQGLGFKSVEHAYQAMKTENPQHQRRIQKAATAKEAKRLGRRVALRANWEEVKIDVMEEMVHRKFRDDAKLRNLLIGTGNKNLIEGNTWGDTFWGMCDGRGENHLGRILMRVRHALGGQY